MPCRTNAPTTWTARPHRYAERLPIGLQSVIKGVPAATIRTFYEKWYRPDRMAVIAVGDFEDPGACGIW